MKKIIYISGSASIIILMVMFYFNIAGGKEGSELKSPESQAENSLQSIGRVEQSNSPQSGGWQLQTMPNMGNRLVRDLYFTDSLTGYAVASPNSYTDSAHILKTTNGGNNWTIKYTKEGKLNRVIFLNAQTGFAGGDFLLKTTNSGENWMVWNWSFSRAVDDMQLFGEDTIWYAYSDPTSGGAYRTTNGGLNWEKRDSGIPANSYPDRIYFYNSRIGFAYHPAAPFTYKTTNGGENWFPVFNDGFNKIYFVDSLKGYKTFSGFYRTTDGGNNWSKDSLLNILGNTYTYKSIQDFVFLNKDTIFCVGGWVYFYSGTKYRTTVYKSTNGGLNWGYQIPDTSYQVLELRNIFSYKNSIWSSDMYNNRLIYTNTGGDSSIYLGISQTSNEVPKDFELNQNYPNPFNQFSIIQFKVSSSKFVKLVVYDISGKEVRTLVNEIKSAGKHSVTFDASSISSGVYFYKISAGEFSDVKRMVLIK